MSWNSLLILKKFPWTHYFDLAFPLDSINKTTLVSKPLPWSVLSTASVPCSGRGEISRVLLNWETGFIFMHPQWILSMTYETPFRMIKRKKKTNEKITHFICSKHFRLFSFKMFIKETQINEMGLYILIPKSETARGHITFKKDVGCSAGLKHRNK